MAYTGEQETLTLTAASLIGAHLPVHMPVASSRNRVGVLADSSDDDVLGLTRATGASIGNTLTVITRGPAKAIAAASLGAGAKVGVGSTNGALSPLTSSGLSTALGSALGAQGARFVVGRAIEAAAAGEIFTVHVDPSQII